MKNPVCRDYDENFEKKKLIIAGIYLKDNPDRLVGLAEMFDYKRRENQITVGYRVNEDYWNKKIASNTLKPMAEYEDDPLQEKNWGGREIVSVDVYTYRKL